MYKILLLEDSLEVQLLVKRALASIGEVVLAATVQRAREELKRAAFDLVILDISLPDGDGLRFCSELKSSERYAHLPVFILSASHSLQEKSLGFQLGIEDFVAKPFEPLELRWRVESRLKKMAVQPNMVIAGNLKINLSSQRVVLEISEGDLSVDLSTTEFKILSFLAKNRDQIKSREQIIAAVWSDGYHLSDRTIDSHISRIRKKIRTGGCNIEAVQNVGYRFSPAFSQSDAA